MVELVAHERGGLLGDLDGGHDKDGGGRAHHVLVVLPERESERFPSTLFLSFSDLRSNVWPN